MFSKACEYGIRAVLFIAKKSADGKRSGFKEIASAIDSPEPFTAKILQKLKIAGILSSVKGPQGGFLLTAGKKTVSLRDIVLAIDEVDVFHQCLLGLKECTDKFPCPVHHEVKAYKEGIRQIIRERTVQGLVEEMNSGRTFLKIKKTRK